MSAHQSTARDTSSGNSLSFTYDPHDPTPSIGGRLLTASRAGYRDDTPLSTRSDVLVFDGDHLTAPLELMGRPRLVVAHSSDNPYCDLAVRISDVGPNGTSHNVSDGFIRLDDAAAAPDMVTIELDAVAYQFAAGHRVRLVIAGGSFPHYERNLGTDEHPGTSTHVKKAIHVIDLDATRLELPTVPPAS